MQFSFVLRIAPYSAVSIFGGPLQNDCAGQGRALNGVPQYTRKRSASSVKVLHFAKLQKYPQ